MTMGLLCWLWILPLNPAMGAATTPLHPLLKAEDNRQANAPILQHWARHPSPAKRARAAVAYGRMQQAAAVMPLMVLLNDYAPSVRAAAAFGLGLLGWRKEWTGAHRPHIINALADRLLDNHSQVQRRALEAIAKYAPIHIEAILQPILRNAPPAIVVEALRALFRAKVIRRGQHPKKKITHADATTIGLLAALASSPSAAVRQHVAYYFARVKDPQGFDILLDLAADKATWTRYFALFALHKLANPKALPTPLASVTHPSYVIRVAAIQAATAAKGAHKLPPSLAKDPTFHVRATLAKAYGASKPFPAAQQAQLEAWLAKDPSTTVRAAALKSLARQLGKTKPLVISKSLQEALTHKSWVIREAAVISSTRVPAQQAALLAMALTDKDPRVQAVAILVTGKRKDKASFTALKGALNSPHLSVRGFAVSAMSKRKEPAALALLWGTYKRSLASKWIELREEIIGAIAKHKTHATTLPWLKQAAKDPAASVAAKAIDTLQKRGVKPLPTRQKPRLTYSPHQGLANAYMTTPKAPAPVVVIVTNKGQLEVTTTPHAAPLHVANLVGRVRANGYNGLGWHRVISNFVIQGGDPDGSGWGDGGYQVRAEINRERYRKGTLGMPRAMGWNTGSVQLFFTHTPTPHLDGRYTVFGHVTKGLHVVDKIERGDKIIRAYIKTAPSKAAPSKPAKTVTATSKPAASKPTSRPAQ